MADINKTIKALTEWIEDPNAMNAEIDGSLVSDALELLKEQHETIKSLEQEIRDKNVRLTERAEQVERLLKKSVPQGVVDQIKWERDTALSQLKEIGKGLGEKMDDVKPMKPHYTTLKYIVSGKEVSVKHPECPKCIKNSGLYLWDAEIERGQAFCKRCGQSIDWSKDGEPE